MDHGTVSNSVALIRDSTHGKTVENKRVSASCEMIFAIVLKSIALILAMNIFFDG